jgi:hypothetical protein
MEDRIEQLFEKAGGKPRLGSGERFAALVKELKGRPGVYDPKGLAAWIGRKKYGKEQFQKLAAKGRKGKAESVEFLLDLIVETTVELENMDSLTTSFPKQREERMEATQQMLAALLEQWEELVEQPVGSGERFAKLKGELSKRSEIRDPGAVAAWIGRKKYGKGRFQKMAAAGRAKKG